MRPWAWDAGVASTIVGQETFGPEMKQCKADAGTEHQKAHNGATTQYCTYIHALPEPRQLANSRIVRETTDEAVWPARAQLAATVGCTARRLRAPRQRNAWGSSKASTNHKFTKQASFHRSLPGSDWAGFCWTVAQVVSTPGPWHVSFSVGAECPRGTLPIIPTQQTSG
jgi:hypothetical protein